MQNLESITIVEQLSELYSIVLHDHIPFTQTKKILALCPPSFLRKRIDQETLN